MDFWISFSEFLFLNDGFLHCTWLRGQGIGLKRQDPLDPASLPVTIYVIPAKLNRFLEFIFMNLQPNSQVTLQGTKPVWHCHSLHESLALLTSSLAPGWNSTCGLRVRAWQEVFLWPKVISAHRQRAFSRYQRCIPGNIFVSYSLKFTIQLYSQHLQSRIFFVLSPCAGGGKKISNPCWGRKTTH